MMKPRFTQNASGKNVVVVGSGPAGLAVADQLNHRGHSVTVVEKHARAGGILTYGIPNMKLPKSVVTRRISLMTDEGVSFVTGVDASDPAIARRLSAEYDAVVLCCGAEEPRNIGVNTDGVSGVCYAMEYLHAAADSRFGGRTGRVCAECVREECRHHRNRKHRQRLCGHGAAPGLPERDAAGSERPGGLSRSDR